MAIAVLFAASAAAVRYAVGLVLVWRYARRGRLDRLPAGPTPPVTLLKPLYGAIDGLEGNLEATLRQNYPAFEVVFCHERAEDPALEAARAAAARTPDVDVSFLCGRADGVANPKAAVLALGADAARHDLVAAADDDVAPDPLYLRDLAAGLAEADAVSFPPVLVGARTIPARLAALAVNTDGMLNVLFAHGRAMTGSTIGVRADALERAGGWRAVGDRIADDYDLGKALRAAGCTLGLARRPARLHSPGGGIGDTVAWMTRWARTILHAAPGWFLLMAAGSLVAPALIVVALATAHSGWAWGLLAVLTGLRAAIAIVVEVAFTRDMSMVRAIPLLPTLWLLEPWGVVRALLGRHVVWRGRRYRLERGRARLLDS